MLPLIPITMQSEKGHRVIWFDILPKLAQKLIVACVLARPLCVLVSMMDELLPSSISLIVE